MAFFLALSIPFADCLEAEVLHLTLKKREVERRAKSADFMTMVLMTTTKNGATQSPALASTGIQWQP